jgi:uncharacterized cupredoxin-like copper-binding protein
MQSVIRVIVTIFFLGLIIMGIVFFSIIAVVPKEKLARLKSGQISPATTTVAAPIPATGVIDSTFGGWFKSIFTPKPEEPAIVEEVPVITAPVSNEPVTAPGPADAPSQSSPIVKEQIPQGTIELKISAKGFSPNTFTVRPGSEVPLALISNDVFSHTLIFDAPELGQIAIGASSGAIRVILFRAPTKPGEYIFRCGVPGHAERGEMGKMIVQ